MSVEVAHLVLPLMVTGVAPITTNCVHDADPEQETVVVATVPRVDGVPIPVQYARPPREGTAEVATLLLKLTKSDAERHPKVVEFAVLQLMVGCDPITNAVDPFVTAVSYTHLTLPTICSV